MSTSSPFFFLFLALSLIYIPSDAGLSRTLRVILLLAVAVLVVTVQPLRRILVANFLILDKWKRILLMVLVFLVVASVIWGERSSTIVFGSSPEYLGLLTWLAFGLVAVMCSDKIQDVLTSRWCAYLFGIATMLSLTNEYFYLLHGYRVGGVMFQATTMAIYATITLILASNRLLHRLPRWDYVLTGSIYVCGLVAVITSQSRVGFIALIVGLAHYLVVGLRQRKVVGVLAGLSLLVLIVAPAIYGNYFSRFNDAKVGEGISYRLDLYKVSASDLVKHHVFFGKGPSSLPTAINNQHEVSEPVAKSLNEGYIFLSTHDLFFDFTYFFGGIALAILLLFTLYAWLGYLIDDLTVPMLVMTVLVINALFNVPSIELTGLLFILILGGLRIRYDIGKVARFFTRWWAQLGLALLVIIVSCGLLLLAGRITKDPDSINAPSSATELTINGQLQRKLEPLLSSTLQQTESKNGLLLLMNAQSGAVEALVSKQANSPVIDFKTPADIMRTDNLALKAWQPGSVIKPLVMAAALEDQKVSPDQPYSFSSSVDVGKKKVTNFVRPPDDGTINDILTYSSNTGTIYLFEQLGDGNHQAAKVRWYQYLSDAYQLEKKTDLAGQHESVGYVARPDDPNADYSLPASAMGLEMTTTPIRLVANYASLVNGGKTVAPYLNKTSPPIPSISPVLSSRTSQAVRRMLADAYSYNYGTLAGLRNGEYGGKSGTAPAPNNTNTYTGDHDIGTYIGFFKLYEQDYVLLARLDEPHTTDLASRIAHQLWADAAQAVQN